MLSELKLGDVVFLGPRTYQIAAGPLEQHDAVAFDTQPFEEPVHVRLRGVLLLGHGHRFIVLPDQLVRLRCVWRGWKQDRKIWETYTA